MLSIEKEFILKCLSDFCNQRKTDRPENDLDFDKIYQLASDHSVEAVIYQQCASWMNYGFADNRFRNSVIQEAYCSANRKILLKELIAYMEEEKISFVCMKGSVFRDYYETPEIRSMGDIDIVIRKEDIDAVDRIFTEKMKFGRFVDNHSVWTYGLKDFEFEVHNHMFYEDLANEFDYIEYFDHIFEHKHHGSVFGLTSEYMYVPDEDYHFLYLLAHTAKHIVNNGSGFRAYLDMVMTVKHGNHDWKWIREELGKIKLLQFTQTCFALCERWFEVKMPLEHPQLNEEFYNRITEKTFHDGIFGLENEENEGAHSAKEAKRDNKGYWFTAIRLTIHALFPPYEEMILAPWYSFLKGKPWLLPFGWIYKWIYCAIHKLPYSINKLLVPFVKKKKIEKRENYIRDWGL